MIDTHQPGPPTGTARSILTRRVVAIFVGLVAGTLLFLEINPLVDLFLRADPTLQGTFSFLNARPFLTVAAHTALVAIAVHRFLASASSVEATRGPARICYAVLAAELLTIVPCVVARDALCGVFYVFVSPFTAIAILLGFAVLLAKSGSRALIAGSAFALLLMIAAGFGAYRYITPKSPAECVRIAEPVKQDACRMNFALQASDAELCETIVFDSSRWSCTYQIAERKGDPSLCERIALPCRFRSPGLACDPDRYRNTCLLVVARKLRDGSLCARMAEGEFRTRCLEQAR